MGKVSDYVLKLVRQRLEEGGPVVWFDPDRTYEPVLACLSKEIPIFRYEDSFLKLRHEVDPHMNGVDPPKIVVYVPLDEKDTHDALVELTAAGITLRPGHPSYNCNTRLSVVARAALKGVVAEETLDQVISKVEAGQLTLAELDRLAEQGVPDLSVLSLVFGTSQPDEITLSFLSGRSKDHELVAKGVVGDLKRLATAEYGADLGAGEELEWLRLRLPTFLLVADCLLSIRGGPASLSGIEPPSAASQQSAVLRLVGLWRNRLDLAASYIEYASQVEKTVEVTALPQGIEALSETETFAATDEALQRVVAEALRGDATESLVEIARRRQRSFWGRQPDRNTRWQLIAAAGDLLLECRRVKEELADDLNALGMVKRYTEGEHPWCELDTSQRRLERLYLEFEDIGEYAEIEKLVSRARREYQDVASRLCERFVSALEHANYKLDQLRQRETFARFVKPLLDQAKVTYILVDAMRYEMGRELSRLLEGEGEVSITGSIATVPTITEIGMASLAPGAEGPVEVVDAGGDKVALKIGEAILRNRNERIAFLQEGAGVPTVVLKLDDFQPFKKATRAQVAQAQLIVITSQEIDMIGEVDNSAFARQTMSQVLDMILRAVRALAREGVEHFIITADHGHLFGEETLSDMLLDKPSGGLQIDLHRRVWIGRGGAVVPNTVRFKTGAFGLGGDLEIVTPRTLACFKAGGGNAFFHGGLSLQELVVPVVSVRARVQAMPTSEISWRLAGPKRVTTRVYSVSIQGEAAGLFDVEAPRVRVELRADGRKVGKLQDADYGLEREAEDITLRATPDGRAIVENHVTFVLHELEGARELEARLLDARSEQVLARIEHIEVAISL